MVPAFHAILGSGLIVGSSAALPRWARRRQHQMEQLAARVTALIDSGGHDAGTATFMARVAKRALREMVLLAAVRDAVVAHRCPFSRAPLRIATGIRNNSRGERDKACRAESVSAEAYGISGGLRRIPAELNLRQPLTARIIQALRVAGEVRVQDMPPAYRDLTIEARAVGWRHQSGGLRSSRSVEAVDASPGCFSLPWPNAITCTFFT